MVGKYPLTIQRGCSGRARILRGTKAAGRANKAKTQHCYYVLLKVGGDFKYAALQHETWLATVPRL